MKKYFILLLLISLSFIGSLFASENKVTVSGYLIDSSSGESLIGANIYVSKLNIGTTTNAYGFYSLSIPVSDSIGIIFSYYFCPKNLSGFVAEGFFTVFKKINSAKHPETARGRTSGVFRQFLEV